MQSQSFEPQWLAGCNVLIDNTLSSCGWALADDPALFGLGGTFCGRVLARVAEWAGQEMRSLDDKLVVDAAKGLAMLTTTTGSHELASRTSKHAHDPTWRDQQNGRSNANTNSSTAQPKHSHSRLMPIGSEAIPIETPIRTNPPRLAETIGRSIGVSSEKKAKCESNLIGH